MFLSKSETIFIVILYLCNIHSVPCFENDFETDFDSNWPRYIYPQQNSQNQLDDNNIEQTAPRPETIETDLAEGDQAEQSNLPNIELCPSKAHGPGHGGHSSKPCNRFKNFIGSNLFDADRKTCFSPEDINMLIARREFELMIPSKIPNDLLENKNVCTILRYFNSGQRLIDRMSDCRARTLIKKAFADTFGGFLHFYLLPASRISYYAGRLKLKSVQKIMAHYDKCRLFLNTNGNGWREPIQHKVCKFEKADVKPLVMEECGESTGEQSSCREQFCSVLDLVNCNKDAEIVDENLIVAVPRTDIEDGDGYLGNIWLPFKKRRTYNLRSVKSTNIVIQFYKSVFRCYKEKGIPIRVYNKNFEQWITEFILPHLNDAQFYPGLGSILSVYKYLRTSCQKTCDADNPGDAMEESQQQGIEIVNNPGERHEERVKRKKDYRTTLKYSDLEKKAQQFSSDYCEMDWLQELNNTMENEPFKSRKIAFEEKQQKDKKKNSFSLSNILKWKGFNFGGTSPAWLASLKRILMYLIVIVLALFLLCLICKLIALSMAVVMGSGGQMGADCCQLIWMNILTFLRQFIKIFISLCSCTVMLMCRCCFPPKETYKPFSKHVPELESSEAFGDSSLTDQSSLHDTSTEAGTQTTRDRSATPELESKPVVLRKSGGRWKRCWMSKKPKDSDRAEKKSAKSSKAGKNVKRDNSSDAMSTTTEGDELPRTSVKPQVSFDEGQNKDDENAKSKRSGRKGGSSKKSKSSSKKRMRGGQSNFDESTWKTDSSRTNARQADGSKTSWKTFYDL